MTVRRRIAAIAILGAALAGLPGLEGVTTIAPAQATGSEAHPGDPALPGGRPVGELLVRSRNDTAGQAIDLRPGALGAGGRLILLVHPGARPRELRVVAVDAAGKRKELGRTALGAGGWQDCTVAIPGGLDADHLQLASPGGEAFWLAGAALHAGGEARLADLAVLPDPLLPLGYDGSQGVTQIARTLAAAPLPGSTLRILLPGTGSADEKAAAGRLVAACVAGWNAVPPPNPPRPDATKPAKAVSGAPGGPIVPAPDSLRWYSSPATLASAADAALAELPQLLVIDLSAVRGPAAKPDAIAKLMTQANRAGVVLAVVVEERPDDARLLREWKQWLTVMHQAAPALGILDLQEAHDWYARPGAAPDGANLLLGDAMDRSATVRVGFADLRARYEWALYEARLEAAPSDNPNRRARLRPLR